MRFDFIAIGVQLTGVSPWQQTSLANQNEDKNQVNPSAASNVRAPLK